MFKKFFEMITGKREKSIRKINKERFIAIVTRNLEKQNKEAGGVHIPEFLEANRAYEEFKKAGCFDENGYLKPMAIKEIIK